MVVRRAKIVCTIGPATASAAGVRGLINAGMDVARLNFSHGTHDDHQRVANLVRTESVALGKPVAALQDRCGPKIRTGSGSPPVIKTGDQVALIEGDQGAGDASAVGYAGLARDLHPGDCVQLDDGRVRLRVTDIAGARVNCVVEQGETLRDRMGVNLPSRRVRQPAQTEKDQEDQTNKKNKSNDNEAHTFVKTADDIRQLRDAYR